MSRNWYELFGKRLLDITVSLFVLVFFFPVFILMTVTSYLCTGQSPIFFQKRLGQDGKLFTIYKFRTMKDTIINGKECKVITKTTKIIRWVGIDELPQFWNVLRGDMSLIGPRPELFSIFRKCKGIDNYPCMLKVKPGLVPVSFCRGTNNYHKRHTIYLLNCDYANNKITLRSDLRIAFSTALKLFSLEGYRNSSAFDAIELT